MLFISRHIAYHIWGCSKTMVHTNAGLLSQASCACKRVVKRKYISGLILLVMTYNINTSETDKIVCASPKQNDN